MASPEPVLYLVRVWHGAGAFRAAARRVDQDTLHLSHSAQELADYLAGDGAATEPVRPAMPDAEADGAESEPAARS